MPASATCLACNMDSVPPNPSMGRLTASMLAVRRAGGPGVGRKIALDVARGLTFLHTNRIAHMDLKTLNGARRTCPNTCQIRAF